MNSVPIYIYSHQQPMMRPTPNESSLFGKGSWDYTINAANINIYINFGLEEEQGTEHARTFESVYTVGMHGFGLAIVSSSCVAFQLMDLKCRYLKIRIYLCWRV